MRLQMVPLLDKVQYFESQEPVNSEDFKAISQKNEELQKELAKRDDIFKEWNEVVDQLDAKLSRIEGENQGFSAFSHSLN